MTMSIVSTLPAAGHQDMAGVSPAESTIPRWLELIRTEYVEMPGLHLTEPQVRRLWGLDSVTAEALLGALTDVRFLRRTRQGAYVRADQG